MKKILIISYFFPPCNLTAANRILNWEKYLPNYGFYPIIITRDWSGKELNEFQRLETTINKETFEKKENAEVYYLPYSSSFRDRCFIKGKDNLFFKYLSKGLTFINLFFQNFFIFFIPYNNLYFKAKNILLKYPDIETVIISANPFEQFFFGYLLKNQFPKLKWIADYRDDWTTTELIKNRTFLQNIIYKIEAFSEKKWLSKADLITSVSPYYVKKISNLVKKKGSVLYNGFNEDLLKHKHINRDNEFTITYNGSLYPTQKIEIALEAFIKLVQKYSKKIDIKIFFPGLEYDKIQHQRVSDCLQNFPNTFFSSNRIPKKEVINFQLKSDVLLMVSHSNLKGVPSSKIFEYIGLRKPIVLCPPDNDILSEIVADIELGNIAENTSQCFLILEKLLLKKLNGQASIVKINIEKIKKYSAKHQAKKLAEILDSL